MPKTDLNKDFADMLEDYMGSSLPERGELLHGTVISSDEDGLVVDLGLKRDGIVPHADLERMDEDDNYDNGDEVYVVVTEPCDQHDNVVLSVFEARRNKDWIAADDLLGSGEMWIGTAIDYNRGGLIVPFGDLRGFVPASQLAELARGLSAEERQTRLKDFVGVEIGLKVIEVDRLRQRLVFSERDAQHLWRARRRESMLQELHVGQVLSGTVSGLRDFGAFVDLGGTDGLVHVSELSWRRLKHPREVVQVGEKVEVKVIRIDLERQRIALSIKELLPDPWVNLGEQVTAGQVITGRVTRVASFGAFVEVWGEVEGLLHKNEIPQDIEDQIVPDYELQLKVIKVDVSRQRMSLSLRDLDTQDSDPELDDGTVQLDMQDSDPELDDGTVQLDMQDSDPELDDGTVQLDTQDSIMEASAEVSETALLEEPDDTLPEALDVDPSSE